MPNNTDTSGSGRAARLRQISASLGPVPVQRPNIGSMALDARLGGGQNPSCCPSVTPTPTPTPPTPSYPTYYLSCVDGSLANTFPPEGPLPTGPFYIDAATQGLGLIQFTCLPSGDTILANTGLPYLVSLPDGTASVNYVYLCNDVTVLVACGIGIQALVPYIPYAFANNTSETFILRLIDSTGNIVDHTLSPLDNTGSKVNLTSWQTDISDCSDNQTIGVYDLSISSCTTQVLNSNTTYYFEPYFSEVPPVDIILRDATNTDIPLTLTTLDTVGPYTNLLSWRPAGCPP